MKILLKFGLKVFRRQGVGELIMIFPWAQERPEPSVKWPEPQQMLDAVSMSEKSQMDGLISPESARDCNGWVGKNPIRN